MNRIVSFGMTGPAPEVHAPLDQMIFEASSQALSAGGKTLADYDLVSLAASDLYDGRGISTMTLTESTGSMGKWEQRVCNDSLVALDLAVAHIDAGLSRAAVVASWHKGSDIVHPSAIASASLEPLYRDLGVPPDVFAALSVGTAVVTEHPSARPMGDVAVAMFVTGDHSAPGMVIRGHRRVTDSYLRQTKEPSARLQTLVTDACAASGITTSDLAAMLLTGALVDADIQLDHATEGVAASCGLGYAAGLVGVAALQGRDPGLYVVCGADSIGLQELAVTILEVPA
jgi:hypothetical protein